MKGSLLAQFQQTSRMPSSVIRKYAYDAAKQMLAITFISGAVYNYLGVPENVYRQMKAMLSKGTFFNRHIKDQYECVKVSDGE